MVVLKGIPSVLTPELLYALAKMGHGDELVLADANFPVSSVCKCGPIEIRADGLHIPELLEAILKLFPLDSYVKCPAAVMDLVESDKQQGLVVPVWPRYSALLRQVGSNGNFDAVERFAFYERAKKAFAVVATGYSIILSCHESSGSCLIIAWYYKTFLSFQQGDCSIWKHHYQERSPSS
ncbi:fucose mutarotase isoform X1 [Hemibagrus wyckioides]|uniref:fucose mutarotase isoform X1 n=1 Tax=Hemibagrus wyckioides TaxID=337641 RepID=UPI00266C531B|nr:fucose mutarotase isoform X1 [Hemibagrus wyckioides]